MHVSVSVCVFEYTSACVCDVYVLVYNYRCVCMYVCHHASLIPTCI